MGFNIAVRLNKLLLEFHHFLVNSLNSESTFGQFICVSTTDGMKITVFESSKTAAKSRENVLLSAFQSREEIRCYSF